mgnify:CR=1 FL=1|tara:strand:+ start:1235 stop:1426 length:192 start_codon:yes stop_codon:yes gene_type:complete
MKKVINSSWFRAALAGGATLGLFITKNPDIKVDWIIFYSGIAAGIGVRELLLAFKSDEKKNKA